MEDTKTQRTPQLNKGVMDQYNQSLDGDEGSYEVGHAGLYWVKNEEEGDGTAKLVGKDGTETQITTTIVLNSGEKKKGNNLSCSVEQGIADYVLELAGDPTNHLPDTKTGVIVWYLSEGIARDFGTTWSQAPYSLGGGSGRGSKSDREKGKRYMTKAEKNSIIERLDLNFYQDDIKEGRITLEDALGEVKKAYDRKAEAESLGYYLSPNKTEGILLYDWKDIVNKAYRNIDDVNAAALYSYQKVEVIVPNLYANYFDDNHEKANKKTTQEVVKSALGGFVWQDLARFGLKGISPTGSIGSKHNGLGESTDIKSKEDIMKVVGHKPKGEVKGIHLAKLKKPGLMKPRYIVIDEYHNGSQTLYLYDNNGSCTTLKR